MRRPRWRLAALLALLALAGCGGFAGVAPTGWALTPPRGPLRPGEVIVHWEEPPGEAAAVALAAAVGGTLLARRGTLELVRVAAGSEWATCQALRGRPGLRGAEPNRLVRSQHQGALRPARGLLARPNDEALVASSPQAGVAATWGLAAIRAEAAWEVTAGDPGIVVAVIDTGIDMSHPDLAANVDRAGARNLVEAGQPPDDDFGHGTHVAGIVAAVGDNGQGGCGVAWRGRVLPIRVLGVDGTGSTWNTVAALDYAVSRGAAVANLSLGSPDYSPLEAEAVQRAVAAGTVVVAAAGNEAGDGNYLEYPASYPGVISVGAVGPDLRRTVFSNFNSWVTLAAPGVDVFSTIPTRLSPGVPYGYLSGTSMAAPMVAGAAALLLTQNPGWTPAQVTERLKRTARDLTPAGDPVPGFDVFHGAGLLDVGRGLGR
ncbi:MAG: S8 family serine peptidase [Candidatus Sericytochromatia bacterium]|nr:S8 family serine peptidase [Candidatus Sericytochromatia bacterium]